MIKLLRRFLFGTFRTLLAGLLVIVALVIGGYLWWAHSRLSGSLDEAGIAGDYTTDYDLVSRSAARIETGFPFTVRVYIEKTREHNWIPTEKKGLVSAVLQWSPDQNRWAEEPREEIGGTKRVKLEGLVTQPFVEPLIEGLSSPDVIWREVAHRELRLRTEKHFGYRAGAPEEDRRQAIARWQAWWSENRVAWYAQEGLEKLGNVLGPR